jgi:Holliday junction resolvase RusA-like endonuclease
VRGLDLRLAFVVMGIPASLQRKNRSSINAWKRKVASAATAAVPAGFQLVFVPVKVLIVYFYEGAPAGDIDNKIKPILDALKKVVYDDDSQVVEVRAVKQDIDGSYRVGPGRALALALSAGSDFVYIEVELASSLELT